MRFCNEPNDDAIDEYCDIEAVSKSQADSDADNVGVCFAADSVDDDVDVVSLVVPLGDLVVVSGSGCSRGSGGG